MKALIAFTILLVSIPAFSQKKLKKLIEMDTPSKIEKFIEKGGEVDTLVYYTSKDGYDREVNPILYAFVFEYYDVMNYFIDHKELFKNYDHHISELFIFSLSHGSDSLSQRFYDLGVDIDDHCSFCHFNNAIMVAAVSGNEDWYFKLKENADVTYINPDGNTLLHAAAESPNARIVQDVLAMKWENLDIKNNSGSTPLDFTVWNEEYPESFNLFLKAGANCENASNLGLKFGYNPNSEIGTFEPGLIDKKREWIFMTDEDEYNILDYTSFFFNGSTSEDQHSFLNEVIQNMKDQLVHGEKNTYYNEEFFLDKDITFNIIDISYQYDNDPEHYLHLFKNYIELIGASVKNGHSSPFTKKEFKYACRRFGKEQVLSWFDEFGVPIPS